MSPWRRTGSPGTGTGGAHPRSCRRDILALARLLVSKSDAEVFGDTEFEARSIVHHLGAAALEERLKKSSATKDRASTAPVANSPRSSRVPPKTPLSLLGPVPCERAYYYCGRCGHGLSPWDRAAGLTPRSFTPATERLVCLAGTLSDGFEEAATRVLPEMAGLKVAETTVQRTTEAVGERVADHLHAGGTFGFPVCGTGTRTRWAAPAPMSAST